MCGGHVGGALLVLRSEGVQHRLMLGLERGSGVFVFGAELRELRLVVGMLLGAGSLRVVERELGLAKTLLRDRELARVQVFEALDLPNMDKANTGGG